MHVCRTMPGTLEFIELKLAEPKVFVFAKRHSPECGIVLNLLAQYGIDVHAFEVLNIDARQDCAEIEHYLHRMCMTDNREVFLFLLPAHPLILPYFHSAQYFCYT